MINFIVEFRASVVMVTVSHGSCLHKVIVNLKSMIGRAFGSFVELN